MKRDSPHMYTKTCSHACTCTHAHTEQSHCEKALCCIFHYTVVYKKKIRKDGRKTGAFRVSGGCKEGISEAQAIV